MKIRVACVTTRRYPGWRNHHPIQKLPVHAGWFEAVLHMVVLKAELRQPRNLDISLKEVLTKC